MATETLVAAEQFVRFIREYAPIARQANMYHEEIEDRAAHMGIAPFEFEHPAVSQIKEHFSPAEGKLINLILTGTAGEGKSRLLYEHWRNLGGDEARLKERPNQLTLEANVSGKIQNFYFIFDLGKCLPDKGQPWQVNQVLLLEGLVESLVGKSPIVFVVAANDGKLLQALRYLKTAKPSPMVDLVEAEVEEMLAGKRADSNKLNVALMDLSGISSAESFDRARIALLARPEWKCFSENHNDPAFGENSTLRRNWEILSQPQFHQRLRTLIELCDVNGFHISVRDLLALLVNGLLGHPNAAERVLTLDEVRQFATPSENLRGSIHRNIFGENLKEERRQDLHFFGYLNSFRVGLETSNGIDELILFGRDLPHLQPTYNRLMIDPSNHDPVNPAFEALRRDYLEAEEFDETKRDKFLTELSQQRRRLFFRIPDNDVSTFDPWHLTIFQYAGKFLNTILHPLKRKQLPEGNTIEMLVRGLNRIWSGMLFDEGNKLFLTSGLDFTSARISRLVLHAVPVAESLSGEKIVITLNHREQPELHVHLLGGDPIRYRLDLMRFEFLVRVAEGLCQIAFRESVMRTL